MHKSRLNLAASEGIEPPTPSLGLKKKWVEKSLI